MQYTSYKIARECVNKRERNKKINKQAKKIKLAMEKKLKKEIESMGSNNQQDYGLV